MGGRALVPFSAMQGAVAESDKRTFKELAKFDLPALKAHHQAFLWCEGTI
jgi:hypothetical protein